MSAMTRRNLTPRFGGSQRQPVENGWPCCYQSQPVDSNKLVKHCREKGRNPSRTKIPSPLNHHTKTWGIYEEYLGLSSRVSRRKRPTRLRFHGSAPGAGSGPLRHKLGGAFRRRSRPAVPRAELPRSAPADRRLGCVFF